METLIDSLNEEEQKEFDPLLFTCCPNCRHQFKIPPPGEVVKGKWTLQKTLTFYDGRHLTITRAQSHLLWELAKSNVPLKSNAIGYRICSANAEDVENVAAVHICRLRKFFKTANIPHPIESIRGFGYRWIGE